MYQMKEQDKAPEKQLDEVDIGNLPEKEFRIMIVKMIQDLGKRMEAKIEKMQEMFNKHLEELKNKHLQELKKKQTEMNNTITEMKNTLEWVNSRITEAEGWISDLEDRMVQFTATEQDKEKIMKRNEVTLRDLWENIKRSHVCIIGLPEGEEREKGHEKVFEEKIVENFPNMGKEIATQVHEGQSPRQDKPKEKHSKTHSTQIDKNYRQRKIIKSNKGKTTNNMQGNSHKVNS